MGRGGNGEEKIWRQEALLGDDRHLEMIQDKMRLSSMEKVVATFSPLVAGGMVAVEAW